MSEPMTREQIEAIYGPPWYGDDNPVTYWEERCKLVERELAESERERGELKEQLKESLADRLAGAAAHQLCSQERNDLRGKLAEAELQRDDLLDACIAEDLAHNHRQTCEWCLAVGWDHPGCWEHAGLRAHAYKLRQAALASVRGDE